MKKLSKIQKSQSSHWVGDGFPVRTIFTYQDLASEISPFLLMDYAGPADFPPTDQRRGVGEHPHRGFETVTIVYSGQVEHRDSAGGGGIIGPGDVQWMTAASGLVHEEFHGPDFAKSGGRFEMIQLWVNLPKAFKTAKPRYQGIKKETIPVVQLPQGGTVKVIAGRFGEQNGPALTFSPVNLWSIQANNGENIELKVPAGHNSSLFILEGGAAIVSGERILGAEMGIFESAGDRLAFRAEGDVRALYIGGEPILEPVVGYGPFVMNTSSEIRQAFLDYQSGKMGVIGPIEGSN